MVVVQILASKAKKSTTLQRLYLLPCSDGTEKGQNALWYAPEIRPLDSVPYKGGVRKCPKT
jgi:hypothetical protein